MNIILLGHRGAGKTAVGKKLALKLWKEFVDLDSKVRDRFDDLTISEIFEQHGQPAFRAAEVEVCKELLQLNDHVIGLGGGTVMQPEARAAIEAAEDCKKIYLYCDAPTLLQRIEADHANAAHRPRLTDAADALAEVEHLLAERDPVYREVADLVFNCTFTDVEQTTQHLVSKL